jgi:aspartyl-tRNA(Asn)/glutamyl-tRNA(Gln) amidotransferase subunit C
MAITVKDVEHVARLAHLEFEEKEKLGFTEKLGAVIGYIEQLNQVDVDGVEPTNHALDIKNVFREDLSKPSMDREKILQNAPAKRSGCFEVPRMVD